MLSLNCHPLDRLLGGGIHSGIITKIYGEAGTGKTNICLQAAKQAAFQNYTVAYIESEPVSHERLHQICNTSPSTCISLLNRIHFYKVTSLIHQEKIIENVIKEPNHHLIIVDTINRYYRMQLHHDQDTIMRSYTRQITNLQLTARTNNSYILVTEQVYTDQQGEIKPFTHRHTEPMIKTILKLEKKDQGQRQAHLMKHSYSAENTSAIFTIGPQGIV